MRRIASVVTLLLSLAAPAAAQKRCVKGIPCGGTCIAANKTCRAGSGSASSAPRASSPGPGQAAATVAEDARFVASSKGQVYYLTSCAAAKRLSPANRISFATEAEARAAGYRPSTSAGCATRQAVDSPVSPPPPP